MNTADSESLARKLLAAGYQEESLDRADVAILNTCVVRQASEERVYSKLHELKAWKTAERTIAVTGCIVAKEGDQLRRRFPLLDAVVPIGEYDDFIAALAARYDYSEGEALPTSGRTGVSHYVRVIQGCDHNCTFCIVPRVRGRERLCCSRTAARTVAGRPPQQRHALAACGLRTPPNAGRLSGHGSRRAELRPADSAGAQATGLRHALMVMSLSCVWAGVHYWLASRTLRRDLETLYVPPGSVTVNPAAASEV